MAGKWLKQITEVHGVDGVYIVSNSGRMIDLIETRKVTLNIHVIADYLLRMDAIHYKAGINLREIEIIWENYRVVFIARKEFVIITLCSAFDALPILRMTLNVVVTHLLQDKKFIKMMKKYLVAKGLVLKSRIYDGDEIKLISKLQS